MTAMATYVTLRQTTCWCGTPFAVPEEMFNAAYNDGHTIYCPHGHTCHWKNTEKDRLRAELERAKRQVAAKDDLLRDTENRLRAQKGATTRAKKRHAAGVCPCCNRTFQQLQRHMATKHPDYDPASPGTQQEER